MASYRAGRMGLAEGIFLVFFLASPRVFLSTAARIVSIVGENAWLAVVTSGVSALIAALVFVYVLERVPGDLFSVSESLLGKMGARLIAIYYILVFFANGALLLRQFTDNTLITTLPYADFRVLLLWYAVGAALVAYFGIEVIGRAVYILSPFVILTYLLIFVLLFPFYNPYNLTPWQGYGLRNALQFGVVGAFNFGILLPLIMAQAFQNRRTVKTAMVFGLGGAVLLKTINIIIYTLVFSVNMGSEKSSPFFEMTRLVYLSRYLQRIEAFLTLLWVIVGLAAMAITVCVGLYLLTRLFNLPTPQPLVPVVSIMLAEVAALPDDFETVIQLDALLIRAFGIGLYIVPALLLVAVLVKGRRSKACPSG